MTIDAALRAAAAAEARAALVTIAAAAGSTPRGPGSRMLVREGGGIVGTVGGGLPEARAIEAALAAMAEGKPRSLVVEMTGAEARGAQLICGGTAEIWIEPLTKASRGIYAAAAAAIDRGEDVVIVASEAAGAVAAIGRSGSVGAAAAHGAVAALGTAAAHGAGAAAEGAPARVPDQAAVARALETGECAPRGADGLIYCPVGPAERLLVLGGGHVGLALARVAVDLGFSVTVADPRPEFSDPARFPETVSCRRSDFARAVEDFAPARRDYAVVVSPGHLGDLECARALLRFDLRYLGIIGSRRKAAMLLQALAEEGFDHGRVESIRVPIGLDIGAQTPEEIAVSIAAELVAARRGSAALAQADADRKTRRRDSGA
jgi:xanthine dehydrogenase accessory factor